MNVVEMHRAFRFGLDKLDNLNYPNFLPEEIDLLLNQAQERFVKQRYGITNPKRTSFEETQKRTEDLKELIKNIVIVPTANSGTVNVGSNITTNSVFCSLPVDQWFIIWERVILNTTNCNDESIRIYTDGYSYADPNNPNLIIEIPPSTTTITGRYAQVRPIQHLEVDVVLEDAFKAPDNDKVLRIMYQDKTELIPSRTSTVIRYLMRYIKKPVTINNLSTPKVDCELSIHTHQEIVDEAIKIALEGIEAKRNATFSPIIDNTKE